MASEVVVSVRSDVVLGERWAEAADDYINASGDRQRAMCVVMTTAAVFLALMCLEAGGVGVADAFAQARRVLGEVERDLREEAEGEAGSTPTQEPNVQ